MTYGHIARTLALYSFHPFSVISLGDQAESRWHVEKEKIFHHVCAVWYVGRLRWDDWRELPVY